MQRVALYARVSTDLQEKEQTIQSQLAVITGHAERHGLRHSTALTYTDDGYSGTWLDRPGLDELRDHAREGRFEVVVVLCPDRLARRYAYQVLLLEELKRAGVAIHFCDASVRSMIRPTTSFFFKFKAPSPSTNVRKSWSGVAVVACTGRGVASWRRRTLRTAITTPLASTEGTVRSASTRRKPP
jgi:hypothetical protein